MSVNSRSKSTSRSSSCTFLPALAMLATFLGPHLGGTLVGEARLGELDIHYSSSSFLET